MKHFVYIDDFGNVAKIIPSNDTLCDLQTMVDGYITMPSGNIAGMNVDVVVNDEGLYRENFRLNPVASFIARQHLVGPAVLVRTTANGDTIGFTDEQIDELIGVGLAIDKNDSFIPDAVAAHRREIVGVGL
jgi:hypothetical protein